MRKVLNILLILFLTSFSFEASAVSPGGIIKLFKGMGKIFKKGADEIPDVGKKLEDLWGGNLKSGSKIDDALNRSSNIDNTSSIKFNETTLSELEKLNKEELLNAHNIKIDRRGRDLDQALDIIDSIDTVDIIAGTASISSFIETEWQGKVFKSSRFFNNPDIGERILLICETNFEDFYFTALFNKANGEWFLLSGNFTNKIKSRLSTRLSTTPQMERQELLVLEDLEKYIFFSNKPKAIKKYPSKYFLITDNAKFSYEKNSNQINDPDYIINKMQSEIEKSTFKCKRKL